MPRGPAGVAAAALTLVVLGGCGLVGAGDPDLASAGPTTTAPSPTAPSSSAASSPTGQVRAGPTSTSPATPSAPVLTTPPISAQFFGVHDHEPLGGGWPKGPVGSFRAWDAGVTWRAIEPSPGVFDFQRLDAIVRTARANGADVLLVLGMTPDFHAREPRSPGVYGLGSASMPRMTAWKRYVSRLAERYSGKGVIFQVWNEANVREFWRGTTAEMAALTKAAHDVLGRFSPRPKLVAPAFVTRHPSQRDWLDRFYAERVGGRPVADWVDVVSLQLYPVGNGTPEDSMALLAQSRQLLAQHGVDKPLWNTEVNYGVTGAANIPRLSPPRQAATVARTYLLNAGNGVERVYWYAWDNLIIGNTVMVAGDRVTPTSAGRGFRTVRSWLKGTRVQPCEQDAAGTYTCTLIHPKVTRRVYWNPKRTVEMGVTATRVERLDGSTRAVPKGRTRINVGWSPVLVSFPRCDVASSPLELSRCGQHDRWYRLQR